MHTQSGEYKNKLEYLSESMNKVLMPLPRSCLSIEFSFSLVIIYFLVGCAATNSQTTPSQTQPAVPESLPSATPFNPAFLPGYIEPTPETTLAATEVPLIPSPIPILQSVSLINPGFEELDSNGMPIGWNQTGMLQAVLLEDRGHSGNLRLTHKGNGVYQVKTWQTISGLASNWYTLRAWVRSSGGQNQVFISLACNGQEAKVYVPPTTPGYRWIQLAVSNQVTDGECTISLFSDGNSGTWASFDDIELVSDQTRLSILGADISSLKKSEDMGGVYRYEDGTQADALQILKDHGLNYARLRVWVDPADGYHNKTELLYMASRLKALNIKLLVDFHYSDNWADPGKQNKPAAWKDLNFDQLKKSVYDHTFDVCISLVVQGTPPDMVQLGNEINAGMLWPDGDYNHFDNLAALLKAGYQAVKDSSSSTLVMLHIAEGGDNEMARWWFDNIVRRSVLFDVIGISYYPFWHGSLAQLQFNLDDISARYDKDVIVVETAYAFTSQENDFLANIANSGMAIPNYPFTPEGQSAMLRDIMSVVRAVHNGRGLGVFYWDATWTAVPGNGWDSADPQSGNAWENQALFDYEDRALPAMGEFLHP
jgi:arabinogalactan endo-1,4-beta-galactosidase